MTFGLRLEAGFIEGAERDDVPADSRFYAGGASSVRGYEYQSIGAREGDTPLGGTDRFISSFEMRYRTGGALGGALFYDAGYIGGGENADDTIRRALGVGFRFFTPMGPLRADLAFPIDKRDGIDKTAQLYVSIGQFF